MASTIDNRGQLRNPVRAHLIPSATHWPWSSLHHTSLVDPFPVPLPTDWLQWIDEPLFEQELSRLRTCLNRQAPFGSADWLAQFTGPAGLDSTLRPRGRPRRLPEK